MSKNWTTLTDMHVDYVATEEKISFETYRKYDKENISFATQAGGMRKCKNFFEHKKLHNSIDNLRDCALQT